MASPKTKSDGQKPATKRAARPAKRPGPAPPGRSKRRADTALPYQDYFRIAPTPLYVWRQKGNDFILVAVNDAAVARSRHAPLARPGTKASHLFDNRPHRMAYLRQCVAEKRRVMGTVEERLITGGEPQFVATTYEFVPPDTVIAQSEVITDRVQAEHALRESEERFRTHFESIPTPIYMWQWTGDDFVMIGANAAGRERNKGTIDRIIGSKGSVTLKERTWQLEAMRQCLEDRQNISLCVEEKMLLTGQIRTVEMTSVFVPPNYVINHITDITERVSAERARRQSEERFRLYFENSPAPLYMWRKQEDDFVLAGNNAIGRQRWKRRPGEAIGTKASERYKDWPWFERGLHRCFDSQGNVAIEPDRPLMIGGEERYVEATAVFVPPDHVILTVNDVTDRRRTEMQLRESEERFRAHFESVPTPIYVWQVDGTDFILVGYNGAAAQRTRGKVADLVGMKGTELFLGRAWLADAVEECARERRNVSLCREVEMMTTGETRTMQTTCVFVPPNIVMDHVEDITERVEAERALRVSEKQYRRTLEASPDAVFIHCDGEIVFANDGAAQLVGAGSPDDLIGKQSADYLAPESRAAMLERRQALVEGRARPRLSRYKYLRMDGSTVDVEGSSALIVWDGQPAIMVTMRDVSERAAMERARIESERRLSSTLQNVADAVVTIDEKGRIETFNKSATKIFGYEPEEIHGENVKRLMFDPDAREHDGYIARYLSSGVGHIINVGPREVTARRKDGSAFPMELTVSEMEFAGKKVFIGAMRDISARRELEDQLRQSQKMEAVGQLTGGLAHDFNNLLTIIQGYLELLHRQAEASSLDHRYVSVALNAAQQAAQITQQLLAFSRRQPLTPTTINLNDLLHSMSAILEHALGEDIHVECNLAEDLWPTLADAAQVKNAALNLCINARDAMNGEGTLTLTTRNRHVDQGAVRDNTGDLLAAGEYVTLSVKDSGIGMPADVLRRAFDPFFTTKPVGEGSGLGLSMVLGFAKQSNGTAMIRTELGAGTEVTLFLPRAAAQTDSADQDATSTSPLPSEDFAEREAKTSR